jgi:Kef-type K+ transport system membrane component KefB
MPDGLLVNIDTTAYILLVFGLFIVPQLLERMRIPGAVTSLALGAFFGMGLGWFHGDQVVGLLSVFGICALFLFAGLEVDLALLRRAWRQLVLHLAFKGASLAGATWLAVTFLGLEPRAGMILALALLTPSTGFILSSISRFGLDDDERQLVTVKAIAAELLALGVLFVAMQSGSAKQFAIASGVLGGMVLLLPIILWIFVKLLLPLGPKSEFAFLLVLAISCAGVTKALGAYYLLGAFLAGFIARLARTREPRLLPVKVVDAIELFAAFFVPFYFLHAGIALRTSDFTLDALLAGGVALLGLIPLRIAGMVVHRRFIHHQPTGSAMRVAISLIPTLVFTLVLAEILRETFAIPPWLYGGLVIYAIGSTLVPVLFLGSRGVVEADYTAPEATDRFIRSPAKNEETGQLP